MGAVIVIGLFALGALIIAARKNSEPWKIDNDCACYSCRRDRALR